MGKADSQYIPQELVDVIIDYLHNDNDTLCTCALVCKRWVPSSRIHLTVKVGYHSADFLQLLDSPGCTFVPFLCRLRISDERVHCFHLHEVLHLVGRLPALHSIFIYLYHYDATWHEAPDLFSKLTTITDLSIGGTCFDDPNDLFDLAFSLPSLRSLHLFGSYHLREDQVLSTRVPIPKPLCNLHLSTNNYTPVLRWLISNDQMPSLHTFRMDGLSWHELASVGLVLGMLGDALQHLELDFWKDERMMDGIGNIDLSQNTSLRSLSLSSRYGIAVDDHLINKGFLPQFLSRISSPYVQEINIREPQLKHQDDIKPDAWADVDRILEMPQFSGLKKLLLTLNSRRFDDLAESARQRLPGCYKRGILVFKAGRL